MRRSSSERFYLAVKASTLGEFSKTMLAPVHPCTVEKWNAIDHASRKRALPFFFFFMSICNMRFWCWKIRVLVRATSLRRFRDLKSEYDALDAVILGVSADDQESHRAFIAELGLNFSLLADTNMCVLGAAAVGSARCACSGVDGHISLRGNIVAAPATVQSRSGGVLFLARMGAVTHRTLDVYSLGLCRLRVLRRSRYLARSLRIFREISGYRRAFPETAGFALGASIAVARCAR